MAKFLKWTAIILGLLVICIGILLFSIDPNQYKSDIETTVTDATGRELTIKGDISWQLFPSIGLQFSDVALMNPQGFPEQPMASVGQMGVSVRLLPLLHGGIEVGDVAVDGLSVHIIKRGDGTSNLDGLTENDTDEVKQQEHDDTKVEVSASGSIDNLSVASVSLNNISLQLDDQQAGTQQHFSLDSFTLSQFEPGQMASFTLAGQASTGDIQLEMDGSGDILVDSELSGATLSDMVFNVHARGASLPSGKVDLSLQSTVNAVFSPLSVTANPVTIKLDDITGTGDVSADLAGKPAVKVNLAFQSIDVNPYLPAETETKETPTPATQDDAASATTEPDLSGLSAANAELMLSIDQVLYKQARLGPVKLKASLVNGTARIEPLSVDLYDGKATLTASLNSNASPAEYQGMVQLSGVQAQPLLNDFADFNLLSGMADAAVNFHGKGLSSQRLQSASNAEGEAHFRNGAYHGLNVALLIRNALNRLHGDKEETGPQQTDFTALDLTFNKKGDIVDNTGLSMQSPLLRLSGHGTYALADQAVDYHLQARVVGSLQGQGGKEAEELKGVTLPLRITGTAPEKLKYRLDMDKALKEKAKDKIDEKKEELKDKLKDKLKNKFHIG